MSDQRKAIFRAALGAGLDPLDAWDKAEQEDNVVPFPPERSPTFIACGVCGSQRWQQQQWRPENTRATEYRRRCHECGWDSGWRTIEPGWGA